MSGGWHAGRILKALTYYWDPFQNFIMPEYEIGGRADLIVLSRARYVTEVEIKISVADWRADRHKNKWRLDHVNHPEDHKYLSKRRGHVARFFYAIPETLEARIPALLPPGVGIIVVRDRQDRYGRDEVDVVREAVRQKSTPMSQEEFHALMVTSYYRYWRATRDIERLISERRWRARAEGV